jgi:hypothetical protein
MDHRARLLAYLREHRDDIHDRIGQLASGKARILEQRGGAEADITAEVLVRLYNQLGRVGALIQEAAASDLNPLE